MAKAVFTPLARQDLLETGDYIAHQLRNHSAARNLIRKIKAAVIAFQILVYTDHTCDQVSLRVHTRLFRRDRTSLYKLLNK